jgi:hypothetical protein
MITKVFHITLFVVDKNTRIVLPEYTWTGISGSALRAERRAINACKNEVLKRWVSNTAEKYGLTAKQLEQMMGDCIIRVPDLVEVTPIGCWTEPYKP